MRRWDKTIAQQLAAQENIILTAEHWDIIDFFREFYQTYELTPGMRPLINHLKKTWPLEKSNSAYLQTLFPNRFMIQVCLIAGLPKPKRCL